MQIHGTCDPGFSQVWDAFAENFAIRKEVGASLSVVLEGRCVVDLWGGYVDPDRTRSWERNSLVCVYSATKGVLAACAHILIEKGLIDIDAPVARYWPEFGRAGKERLPVRYLLTHQAGLPAIREALPLGS